jgi:hypothetical protein
MENAVLACLNSAGMPNHPHLAKPMEVLDFKTSMPVIRTERINTPVIYHPTTYNYPILDGIIVFIEGADNQRKKTVQNRRKKTVQNRRKKVDNQGTETSEGGEEVTDESPKQKLFLYPYQVTLHRKGHDDSHALFFKKYDEWVKNLKMFDVETEFLWFTGDKSTYIDHPLSTTKGKDLKSGTNVGASKTPKNRERYVNFGDLDKYLGQMYEEAQVEFEEWRAKKEAEKSAQDGIRMEEEEE